MSFCKYHLVQEFMGKDEQGVWFPCSLASCKEAYKYFITLLLSGSATVIGGEIYQFKAFCLGGC